VNHPSESGEVAGLLLPRAATTVDIMSKSGPVEDPLHGWDPRRRVALERIRAIFKATGDEQVGLSDELIAERRLAAAAEDGIGPGDPAFGRLLEPPARGAGSTGE
jgi:hypothetical protein